jgi:hypothetical protein
VAQHPGFKMLDRLAPCFIAKYARLYEILHKPHLNVYTLKLPTNFVAHPTFHILKLKLFLCDEQRLDGKQRVQLEINVVKHRLAAKIENIFRARQTCLKCKEYLVKYKGCHQKEAMWMKPIHLYHLPKMINKFE